MSKFNSMLIPNVSVLPTDVEKAERASAEKANTLKQGQKSDFNQLLEKLSQPEGAPQAGKPQAEINVSTHAMKRLQERNIELDGAEYSKLKEALMKLKSKGGHDSLVITPKAAYVLDVDRNTVVTAVDRASMNENVFTKIDSTVFMM
jgi:flagellar operon protein